jgi:nitrite reductase (NADH) small subunit
MRLSQRRAMVYFSRKPGRRPPLPCLGNANAMSHNTSTNDGFVTIAKVGGIPEGEGRSFQVGERLVAVFLQGGQYYAIDDLCPHMGASLGAGYLDEEGNVTCPWHAWRFCVRDGKWCDNPRLGVDTFDVRVIDDQIQVRSRTP